MRNPVRDPGGANQERKESVMSIKQKLLGFLRDEEGLTTVEYAVAGGLVALAVITAFTALGTNVGNIIQDIVDLLPGD
jgi:pilus assembly protein Flp/PilA